MRLSRRSGGILAHSPLQDCFNSTTLQGFCAQTGCLRSQHGLSVGFQSGLRLIQTLYVVLHKPGERRILRFCCRTQVAFSFRQWSDVLSAYRIISPKVLGMIKMFLGKCGRSLCSTCSVVLAVVLSHRAVPAFFIAESWILTLPEARVYCSSHFVLASLVTSWMSGRCTLI